MIIMTRVAQSDCVPRSTDFTAKVPPKRILINWKWSFETDIFLFAITQNTRTLQISSYTKKVTDKFPF